MIFGGIVFLAILGNITQIGRFLGTCRFLGTTMLIFEKFVKSWIFFIYWSLPSDGYKKKHMHISMRVIFGIFDHFGYFEVTLPLFQRDSNLPYGIHNNYGDSAIILHVMTGKIAVGAT